MRRLFIFVALLGLLTGPVFGQGATSGTIEGTVTGEGGGAIADAIITAMGPQGTFTSVADSSGRYVLTNLSSGVYTVKAEAGGFATIVQSDVQVSIGRKTQLPFTLTKGMTEEVTVTSEAPIVDLKSTTTGQNIRIDDFAPYVPLGRNIVSIFTIAPGVSDGGDPVLGSTNSSISGSSGLENAYFVDGVNITNSGYGGLGAYSIVYGSLGTGVTYDFLEEVDVKTGGFEAEFGQAGGGIISTVVKSGSNKFGFDVNWYEEPGSFEGQRGDRTDTPNIANAIESVRRDISVTAGGPIMEDKLFYFGAYNPVTLETDFKLTSGDAAELYDLDGDGVATDSFAVGQTIAGGRTPASITRERTIDNYAAKVSWFATSNHRLEATAFGDPSDGEVGGQAPTTFLRNLTDPVAIPDPNTGATGLDWGGDQLTVKYQGIWTSNFFTEIQISDKKNEFLETGPGTTFRSIFDVDANATAGGAGFYEELSDEVTQLSFKNTHIFGNVEVSYGWQEETIEWAQPRLRSGPTYTGYFPNLVEDGAGGTGFATGCADPSVVTDPNCYTPLQSTTGASVDFEGSATGTTADDIYNVTRTVFTQVGQPTDAEERNAFVQTSWDVLPNLTLKGGLRWTEQELTGSGSETLPIGTLSDGTTVGGINTLLTGQNYKFDSEIAPRFGVAWDVMSDGRHKLYANFGEYYQRVPSDLAVRAFSNEVGTTDEVFLDAGLSMPALNATCGFDANGDGVFDGTPAETRDCHLATSVQGLAGGGSIILDGSQLIPGSDVNSALGDLSQLTTGDATKLPYTEEWLAGYAWEVNDYTGVEVRYIHRELGQVLEDIQFASNEQTWNLFFGNDLPTDVDGNGVIAAGEVATIEPFQGQGTGAFGAYVFANVGGNVDTSLFPLPTRDYNALEFVFNRRFNNGWLAYANYRFARLNGNYEGSFRNDNGQSDPFLTSLFDFPAASPVDSNGDGTFDSFPISNTLVGQYQSGPLNTERTHIFNGFLSKVFDMGLNVGGRINVQTGQPRGPLFAHPTYRNAGEIPGFDPVYWFAYEVDTDGDGLSDGDAFVTDSDATLDVTTLEGTFADVNGDGLTDEILAYASGPRLFSYTPVERDFFGRTPAIVTFDMHASYDIELRDSKSQLTLLLDIFNLFNDNNSTRFDNNVETRPGAPNPDYLKANGFQAPRNVRLGAKFTW